MHIRLSESEHLINSEDNFWNIDKLYRKYEVYIKCLIKIVRRLKKIC